MLFGFYYLQSRYYDPAIRRFINADGYVSTGQDFTGYNMFAYCNNNPIMYTDPTGNFGFLISAAIVLVGGLVSAGMSALTAATTGGDVWESAAEGLILGLWGTGCSLYMPLLVSSQAVPFIAAAGGSVIDLFVQKCTNDKIDWFRTFKTGVATGIGAAIPAFHDFDGTDYAFGTALVWAESSILIGSADMIIENIREQKSKELKRTENSKLSNKSMLYHKTNSTLTAA